jgi:hypothetical protein
MTIINYIIRFVVACSLVFSFILTLFLYSKATVYESKIDALTCMSSFLFLVFAYLLWIIK